MQKLKTQFEENFVKYRAELGIDSKARINDFFYLNYDGTKVKFRLLGIWVGAKKKMIMAKSNGTNYKLTAAEFKDAQFI
jgi:hypothetical protein